MILITGANGNLGRRLIGALLAEPDREVRAVVRSERAAAQLEDLPGSAGGSLEVVVLDYLDVDAMTRAASGCSHIVHLVGIIRESVNSSFEAAHEGTSGVVAKVAAAAGVQRIVYLSILGARRSSSNDCLASKARAEDILLGGRAPALVLRVPMVLGEDDYASRALSGRAQRSWNLLLRASSLEQPIYAGDVVQAILAGIRDAAAGSEALDLAGPESLTRGALTRRAAATFGRETRIVSIPLWIGTLAAWLLERLSDNPPLSRAMLGVLDHDDRIDPSAAVNRLGLSLTPLTAALESCLQQPAA